MTDQLFNPQGEMNAYDKSDAMRQLVKFAGIIANNEPSNTQQAGQPTYGDMEREALLQQALTTQEGKIALGQAMANPIRRNLDYQGVGRKALVVDPLPQGALPVYDKDIDVSATIVSSNGSAPESRIFGDRVTIPEFEVVSNPTVRIAEVKRRRFNVIDRAQQKARQEIQAQEDANIFAALTYASDVSLGGENAVQVGFSGPNGGIGKLDLLEGKKQIDRWDLVTTKFFMNIQNFTEILAWESASGNGYSDLDPVTQREILQTGLYAHLWGADIIVSKIVPVNTIFCVTDPEFVGVMPIRQDIEVLPADEPKQLKLGWVVNEIVGIGIVNPRGTSQIRKV